MTDRKKPGVAFWASVVVVSLSLLYVLSWGPMLWLKQHHFIPEPLRGWPIYAPLVWLSDAVPPFGHAFKWYIKLWWP